MERVQGVAQLQVKSGTHALAMGKYTLLTVKTRRQVAVSKQTSVKI